MIRRLGMDDVMAKVPALPALPQIVKHILDSLANENVDLDSLGSVIASDPAVAVRLLAAANTGMFGGHKVSSLRQAMMLLGIGRHTDRTRLGDARRQRCRGRQAQSAALPVVRKRPPCSRT